MRVPVMTHELVDRLERAGTGFLVRWLEGLPADRGVTIARFGDAVAFTRPSMPDLDFMNRVHGLTPAGADEVPAIGAHYASRGIRPWFELAPADGFEELASALASIGARQTGFFTGLYGVPEARPGDAPGVEVRLAGPDDAAVFADLRVRSHVIPPDAARDVLHWTSVPGWTCYIATVDGEPAGVATLATGDGVGYLADAATLPSARGRGVQSALIRARLGDANEAGCDVVCSGATFGSTSMRNLQRQGLRVACTKAVWRVEN